MKGKILWDYIEQQAIQKLTDGRGDWRLVAVDILDNEIAKVRLQNQFNPHLTTAKREGLVVYSVKEDAAAS